MLPPSKAHNLLKFDYFYLFFDYRWNLEQTPLTAHSPLLPCCIDNFIYIVAAAAPPEKVSK